MSGYWKPEDVGATFDESTGEWVFPGTSGGGGGGGLWEPADGGLQVAGSAETTRTFTFPTGTRMVRMSIMMEQPSGEIFPRFRVNGKTDTLYRCRRQTTGGSDQTLRDHWPVMFGNDNGPVLVDLTLVQTSVGENPRIAMQFTSGVGTNLHAGNFGGEYTGMGASEALSTLTVYSSSAGWAAGSLFTVETIANV